MAKQKKINSSLRIVQRFFPSVATVNDGTKKTVIEVTTKDAASKAVRDYGHCVMAVACKRQLKLDGVIISRAIAYMIKGTQATRYTLPPSVSREIVSFDRGATFEPGTYELAAICKSKRLGSQRGRHLDPGRERTGKNVRSRHVTTNIRQVLGGQKPADEVSR